MMPVMQTLEDTPAVGPASQDDAALLPRHVRRVVLAVVGILMAAAAYLVIARGPAILFDLARSAAAYCF